MKEHAMDPPIIPFHSELGQTLYNDSLINERSRIDCKFIAKFRKQLGLTTCGIASCTIVLDSFFSGDDENISHQYAEERLLTESEIKGVVKKEIVLKQGTNLLQVSEILRVFGCKVNVVYATQSTLKDFRDSIYDSITNNRISLFNTTISQESFMDSKSSHTGAVGPETKDVTGIVVNYLPKELGYANFENGHHSPLGGYNFESDRCLILDTWPEFEMSWVKVDALFKAMKAIDPTTTKSRGWVQASI